MSSKLSGIVQAVAVIAVVQAIVLALRGDARVRPAPLLDERAGRVREVAVHFVPSSDLAHETYRQFFAALPGDVKVYVAVERIEDMEAFTRLTGRTGIPVVIGKPITTWARDRFAAADGVFVVPPEAHEGGAARRNDALVPFELARACGATMRVAPFRFDGGDFCAADGRVIATSTWTARNPERSPEELVKMAEMIFGQPVVYVPDAPEHHVGMAAAPVAPGMILVGDVRWGRRLAPEELDADLTEETARRFDAMAEGLERAGFRVVRIPAVPTLRDFVWVTYTNAIFDGGVVYMPAFGFASLDAEAAKVYRGLGFDVKPVDVSRTFGHGGTLHCLVHVLRRD